MVKAKTFPRVIELFKEDLKPGGTTLRGIVRKTGLNSNTIANYLEGTTEPTQKSLERISAAYHKSVAWLRGDSDDATAPDAVNDNILDISVLSPEQREAWDFLQQMPPEKQKKVCALLKLVMSDE